MELSKRLKAVAESVTRGNVVADVGCDHAYISIYLIEKEISPYVLAMDVNKGPLKRAAENIKKYQYEEKIETRLSNGLHRLEAGEADTILLAGMGGVLMTEILEAGRDAVASAKELVLQPQSEIPSVRKYLHSIGYEIVSEKMLTEDEKYYVMIKASNKQSTTPYDREEYYLCGKLLLEEKNMILKEYLLREKEQKEKVVEGLSLHTSLRTIQRKEEILEELQYIKAGLNYL